MGDQKTYPLIPNAGECQAKRRRNSSSRDSPEEKEERRDKGEGEEGWTQADIHICALYLRGGRREET